MSDDTKDENKKQGKKEILNKNKLYRINYKAATLLASQPWMKQKYKMRQLLIQAVYFTIKKTNLKNTGQIMKSKRIVHLVADLYSLVVEWWWRWNGVESSRMEQEMENAYHSENP